MKKTNPLKSSLRTAAIVIIGVVIYAYGFEVTQMGFDEIYSPTRQASLTRVIRALFHPEILEFDTEETPISKPFYAPCQSGAILQAEEPSPGMPYLVVTPSCADPRAEITVEGFNFQGKAGIF